jgi:hypothetical protein
MVPTKPYLELHLDNAYGYPRRISGAWRPRSASYSGCSRPGSRALLWDSRQVTKGTSRPAAALPAVAASSAPLRRSRASSIPRPGPLA